MNLSRVAVVVTLSMLLLTGCSLFSSSEPVDDPPPGAGNGLPPMESWTLILSDDFLADDVGAQPSQWIPSNANGVDGKVEVIDADTDSGRGLRVEAYAFGEREGAESKNVSIRLNWDARAAEATTIAVEHQVKWVEGTGGIYFYVIKGGNAVQWYIDPRVPDLIYNAGSDHGSARTPVVEGWNRIRVVADRVQNKAWVFVNDMDTPVIEHDGLLRRPDSWDGANMTFSHWTHTSQDRKVEYGDIKVWVVN